jgi:type VI protein secretion system component Hcp
VPAVQEIVITKLQNSVSTALFWEALGGNGKLIVIAFVKGDGTTYLKIVLQNTLISSHDVSGHGGITDSSPTESLSLNFHQHHLRRHLPAPRIRRYTS